MAALTLAASCVGDPTDPVLSAAERDALSRYVQNRPPSQLIGHEASFGGAPLAPQLELVGYLLTPRRLTHRAGSTFRITFVWRVHEAAPGGFRLFTHLVDAHGRMLANLDSQGPLRARPGRPGAPFPPSAWPRDRFVLDAVDVTLPGDAPGRVALRVGFHRGGARLAAHGDGTLPEHGAAVIALSTTPAGQAAAGAERAPDGTDVHEAAPTGVESGDVPSLEVPRLREGTPIQLDGVLDEPAWAAAARTGAFVNPATGAPADASPVQGSARLMYDAHHLWFAFEVSDRDVQGGFPAGARDPHLWTRDTVELMFDPDGDGDNRDYYELQIGPQNLVFDSFFDDYNTPRGGPDGPFGHQHWSSNVKSAVRIAGTLDDASDEDGGYVVEARMPFSAFDRARRSPPRAGETWRANFYAMQNNGGVAWSPILRQGNFHKASRFGRITWGSTEIP